MDFNIKEDLEKSYEDFVEIEELSNNKYLQNYTKKETKFAWLSSHVFNLTTYDNDLDVLYGRYIFDVLKAIQNKEWMEWCKDGDIKYPLFIAILNLLERYHMIEWGTSIRSCWLNFPNKLFSEEAFGYLFEFIEK